MESSSSSSSASTTLQFVLGSYTKPMAHVPGGRGMGISLASLDPLTGKMILLSQQESDKYEKMPNPSFIAVQTQPENGDLIVYSLSEVDESATVNAILVKPPNTVNIDSTSSNTVTNLDDKILYQDTFSGQGGAHLEIDTNGKFCFLANYVSGNIAIYGIENSSIEGKGFSMKLLHESQHGIPGKEDPSIIFPSEKFPNRQEAAHAHQIRARKMPPLLMVPFSENVEEQFILYVPDLGMDRIVQYSFRVLKSKGTTLDRLTGKELMIVGGPRHLDFHPFLRNRAYVSIELVSRVGVLAVNEATGLLEELIEETSTLSESDLKRDDVRNYLSSHIEVHPSGKFVFVANRSFNGNCSIVAFRIDFDFVGNDMKGTGNIRNIIGHYSTRGDTPRNFTISPGVGDYLLVGNQDSHTVQAFKIDLESGTLCTNDDMTLQTASPSCIKFIP